MAVKKVYKVIFYNNEEIFEVYAAHVFPSEMYGFIEVEELLFGERSQLLVDPSEEKLKTEFSGVNRTYIPMNAIVRIDVSSAWIIPLQDLPLRPSSVFPANSIHGVAC